MSRFSKVALFAVAYGVVAFVVILAVGVWATWSPIDWSRGEPTLVNKVVDTWMLLGLVPTFALAIGAIVWEQFR